MHRETTFHLEAPKSCGLWPWGWGSSPSPLGRGSSLEELDGSGLGKEGGKGTSGKGTACEKAQRPRGHGFATCQDFHVISGEKVGLWRGVVGEGQRLIGRGLSSVPRDLGFQLKATRSH